MLGATQELDWHDRPKRLYHVFERLNLLLGGWNLVQSNAVPPVTIDTSDTKGFYKVEVEYEIP